GVSTRGEALGSGPEGGGETSPPEGVRGGSWASAAGRAAREMACVARWTSRARMAPIFRAAAPQGKARRVVASASERQGAHETRFDRPRPGGAPRRLLERASVRVRLPDRPQGRRRNERQKRGGAGRLRARVGPVPGGPVSGDSGWARVCD